MVIHHTPYILRNEVEVIAYLHYSLLEMGKGRLWSNPSHCQEERAEMISTFTPPLFLWMGWGWFWSHTSTCREEGGNARRRGEGR